MPGHSSHQEEWKKMRTSFVTSFTTSLKVVPTTICTQKHTHHQAILEITGNLEQYFSPTQPTVSKHCR